MPQNRERVFVVSILGEHEPFEWPTPIPLDKCIRDILEEGVDEKYYIKYDKPFPKWQYSKNIIGYLDIGSYELNNRVYGVGSCSFTIRAKQPDQKILVGNRLRKLTPRECFRLMGMRDSDIDKIQKAGISNTQQYKLAGNSIVVDVLEAIFKNLFKGGNKKC